MQIFTAAPLILFSTAFGMTDIKIKCTTKSSGNTETVPMTFFEHMKIPLGQRRAHRMNSNPNKPSNQVGIHYRVQIKLEGDLTNPDKKSTLMLFENTKGNLTMWIRISEKSRKCGSKYRVHQYPLEQKRKGVFEGQVGGIFCEKRLKTSLKIEISSKALASARKTLETTKAQNARSSRKNKKKHETK